VREGNTVDGDVGPTDHRPWATPARPWSWRQTWHDLLFLHWPVPAGMVRGLVPRELEIDRREGQAWVGVIPFWMSGVTLRRWPAVPGLSRFPELNVRTYVALGDKPGVWFFSLDAASRLAVAVARRLFHLPYVHARMTATTSTDCAEGTDADGVAASGRATAGVQYRSERKSGEGFVARYRPSGPVARSAKGSLAHFLTERYCLYAATPRGLGRAEIHHAPWPLQPASVSVARNDMLAVHGIQVAGEPVAHYARKIDVRVWSLAPVRPG